MNFPFLGSSLPRLAAQGHRLLRAVGLESQPATGEHDPEAAELMRQSTDARASGRVDEARTLLRHVAARWPAHAEALRVLRDLAADARDWEEAITVHQRLAELTLASGRAADAQWLAVGHYELGRRALADEQFERAIGHLRSSLHVDRDFAPAAAALGDAFEAAGDRREAVRAWERAVDNRPALAVLVRLERAYRDQGRPTRMIALYRAATKRAPDDLALAAALGRVYFELEMLDEAAEQFEKLEVRAPDVPAVHAYLGAVFERRGETREACEEYRRALRLGHAFDWPHRCTACGATAAGWEDRCPSCHRWNTLGPIGSR